MSVSSYKYYLVILDECTHITCGPDVLVDIPICTTRSFRFTLRPVPLVYQWWHPTPTLGLQSTTLSS
jgi:hypothetical protein